MKFYLGDDKRLIVESSWHDRFDYKGEIYVNEPKTKYNYGLIRQKQSNRKSDKQSQGSSRSTKLKWQNCH